MIDKLSFDLINFDLAHSVFPTNACSFIVHMTGVDIPTDTIPVFDSIYGNQVGATNDFEAVAFYSDFSRLVQGYILNPEMKNHIMGYFQVRFNTDPTIDLMCSEAFQPRSDSTKSKILKSSPTKSKKRAKKYNTPVVCTRCDSCDKQSSRMKLIKRITTCSDRDLIRYEKFWRNLKLENSLITTLPPVEELDPNLYADLMVVIHKRDQEENEFVDDVLPAIVDRIKTVWYETPQEPHNVVYVPGTDSDNSL